MRVLYFKLFSPILNNNICRSFSLSANVKTLQKTVNSCDNQDDVDNHTDLSICPLWDSNDDEISKIKTNLLKGMTVIPNFITEEEETSLYNELQVHLKKMRYEFDCWDNAIHGFRETEKATWKDPKVTEIINRAKSTGVIPPDIPLDLTHILDLDPKGFIKPHVDSVRFCGSTVAGICLLSAAVMRLRNCSNMELFADFLLSRRCFYIMKDAARYDYTHEILEQDKSIFKGNPIVRTRRISVITRTQVPSSL